ncbi:MAG: T9SS type A sorting domain-containing protein [Candidatus Marinimicrobia bacterium]|nr:T9SS type A sorting domain-containing protein [Candidatus Neomarinimicrobiota bacterium]
MKKRLNKVLPWIVLLFLGFSLYANPIELKIFSEIQFSYTDSTDWIIELQDSWGYSENMDGWYITSSTDTAYFNFGLNINHASYPLVRSDSLQTLFTFNVYNDVLTLYDSLNQWIDAVSFGDREYANISSPFPGQSISLCQENGPEVTDSRLYWYIDNTPSIGVENDYEGGYGTVSGNVHDADGNLQEGVRIIYGYGVHINGEPDTLDRFTDSLGFYQFWSPSQLRTVTIHHTDFISQDTIMQVWPDSTSILDFVLLPVVGIENFTVEQIPRIFELRQNYPNPFNPSTNIEYDLPEHSEVSLIIYDVAGRELQTLVSTSQDPGSYNISWGGTNQDGQQVSAGMYFARLQAGKYSSVVKMVYLR